MSIRVLVGEDNYLAREGIERVLQHTDDVTHIGTCADLDTLRQAVAEMEPDVVLTDIRMSTMIHEAAAPSLIRSG